MLTNTNYRVQEIRHSGEHATLTKIDYRVHEVSHRGEQLTNTDYRVHEVGMVLNMLHSPTLTTEFMR